jgi:ribosome-associated toxin RatA of RatAB toxin-antitoxin module
MPAVRKSALVPFSADSMFALVDEVEAYPKFLPWCSAAKVLERNGELTRARIQVSYLGVSVAFATKNLKQRPSSMSLALEDGPFRELHGSWRFEAIENLGCRVELALQYEFESVVLAGAVGPVFDRVAGSLVDSFVAEAERRAKP